MVDGSSRCFRSRRGLMARRSTIGRGGTSKGPIEQHVVRPNHEVGLTELLKSEALEHAGVTCELSQLFARSVIVGGHEVHTHQRDGLLTYLIATPRQPE